MKPVTSLRMPTGSWTLRLAAAGVILGLTLTGCGSGDTGPAGPAGSSGTPTDSGITTGTTLTATDNSPGVVLNITGVSGGSGPSGTFKVGDVPSVTFNIKKNNGAFWHLSEMGPSTNVRIILSGPTGGYQRVLPLVRDVMTRAVTNGDGTYTYTFASPIPAVYASPDNDAGNFPDGNKKGQALEAGTYTIGMAAGWNYTVDGVSKKDSSNDTYDIVIGNASLSSREVVKMENCQVCHVNVWGHGGSYRDPKVCVLCHTAGTEDRAHVNTVEFKVMIHKIHNGSHLPSVLGVASDPTTGVRTYTATPTPYRLVGFDPAGVDFSKVVFPVFPSFTSNMPKRAGYSSLAGTTGDTATALGKENAILKGVVACYKCHGDPDGSGSMTAPANGNLCYTMPSRRACGSCHDDVNFTHSYTANGMTMANQTNDASCLSCHAGSGTTGIAVTGGTVPSTPFAHVHPLADSSRIAQASAYQKDIKFAVTALTRNGAAGNFAAGDKPQIAFTIKDNSSPAVDIPLYKLSATSTTLAGPNDNRQLIFPMNGPKSATVPIPVDFSGRLVSTSSSGKGIMSRVVGSTVSETLKVGFSTAAVGSQAFTVYNSLGTVNIGTGTLSTGASTGVSTNGSGTSISQIEIGTATVVENITIQFTGDTTFTVTGSTTGAMGGGTIPWTSGIACSYRYTSPVGLSDIAFTLNVSIPSATVPNPKFANGQAIYLTVATATGGHKFAIAAGRTAFSTSDRFYYDTVNNGLASYIYNLPMDMFLEFAGDGNGSVGQTLEPMANLPVYWGRETVYERTSMAATAPLSTTVSVASAVDATVITLADTTGFAIGDQVQFEPGTAENEFSIITAVTVGAPGTITVSKMKYVHNVGVPCLRVMETTLGAVSVVSQARYVTVADASSFAVGDNVVIGEGTAGEEYLQVGLVSGTQVWFSTPLRYAHAGTDTIRKVKLTQRLNYTLDPVTGIIANVTTAFASGNAIVVSYRTDGSFGWRRGNTVGSPDRSILASDATRAIYPSPMNDSPDLGQSWGEWQGLRFQNGTYAAAIWGSLPVYVTQNGETQTYSISSSAAVKNFIYGSGTVTAYNLVTSENNCATCHDGLNFHGGSRKGNDSCLMCHATAGCEDWPAYNPPTAPNTGAATTGTTVNFRTMLHKIHKGADLYEKSTYTVVGNSGGLSTYEYAEFPAQPGGTKACTNCHGNATGSSAKNPWKEPGARTYSGPSTAPTGTASWKIACASCHDTPEAGAHITAMTTGGVETCVTCHSAGQVFGIDTVHKNR